MIGNKKQQQRKGFTLMEVLVALGIFVSVIVISADLFSIATKAQRETAQSQAKQSEAIHVLHAIGEKARFGELVYDQKNSMESPSPSLYFIDARGKHMVFRTSSKEYAQTVCPSPQAVPCIEMSEDGGQTFVSITSDKSRAILTVFVSPKVSPFLPEGGPYQNNQQPLITLNLRLLPFIGQAGEGMEFFQTTVSSRTYLR